MADHQSEQEQETVPYNREEDYLQAQRAAVEAVAVGRETLQTAVQQGEQLERSEQLADETQYKLSKAGRVLRGMTWSGWVANMFTHDMGAPPDVKAKPPPMVYEQVPDSCRSVAQAIQNYHANVNVFEECETEDQKSTCGVICENMYAAAVKELETLNGNKMVEAYRTEFASDLQVLRERQLESQQRRRGVASPDRKVEEKNRTELLPSSPDKNTKSPTDVKSSPLYKQQEEHLQVISENLGELGHIAHSLSQSIHDQNQRLESLDTKSDNILEKSRQVTRRADRLVQKKSWSPVKPTYACSVSIRHIESGKYLAVVKDELCLVPKFHPETCVFALWKRQGEVFGLKSKFNNRWVGQNLFGSLMCNAYSFGRREEWECDPDWDQSRLLCTSVSWGAGGYLLVRDKNHAVQLGGSSVADTKKAALWVITNLDAAEEEEDK